DSSGQVFLAGWTLATNFPIVGGFDTTKTNANEHDTVIAIFDSALTNLEKSTYLGGGTLPGSHTTPFGLALADSGKIYVAGYTASSAFPTTVGAYDESPPTDNQYDAYITV